jgi:hypothetical protein
MAIRAEAQFNYTFRLRRGLDAVWRGEAHGAPDEPHLVGPTPRVSLSDGVLSLTAATSLRRFLARSRGVPMAAVASIGVGAALEAVLEDDDAIRYDRDGMGALGLVVTRGDRLVLAIGAVTPRLGDFGLAVETDPRADDVRFYYMRSLLDDPKATLVWLDPGSPEYESQLAELDRIPPHVTMVSIAARADDWTAAHAVNERALGTRRHRWGMNFERVDTRIRTRDDFVAHLRSLPKRRPDDFFVRFTVEGCSADVREGEGLASGSWLFYVAKVASTESAWTSSQVGVAREHPALTVEALRESVQQFEPMRLRMEL